MPERRSNNLVRTRPLGMCLFVSPAGLAQGPRLCADRLADLKARWMAELEWLSGRLPAERGKSSWHSPHPSQPTSPAHQGTLPAAGSATPSSGPSMRGALSCWVSSHRKRGRAGAVGSPGLSLGHARAQRGACEAVAGRLRAPPWGGAGPATESPPRGPPCKPRGARRRPRALSLWGGRRAEGNRYSYLRGSCLSEITSPSRPVLPDLHASSLSHGNACLRRPERGRPERVQ